MSAAHLGRGGDQAKHRDAAVDWLLALLSFGLALTMFATGGLGPAPEDQRGLDALGVLVAAGISLPLLARRRAPVAVFLTMAAALLALTAFRYPPDVTVGPWVALFTLAKASGPEPPTRLAGGLVAGSFLALAVVSTIAYGEFLAPELGFIALLWAAIWLAGRGSRLKGEQISSLEERAARAEEEARRERQLAAAEERTRIARDLHDSAGHAINVILMQAGAARLLRERDPDRAEQALRTIEEVAREQIGEIDRLVSALRAKDPEEKAVPDCSVPGEVPTGPAAGKALLERMRASGLDLSTEWRGEERLLGPTVGRATYRILQEALTNAVRHGTGSASVMVSYGGEAVELTIENPLPDGAHGEAVASLGDGEPDWMVARHGITGMRERAGLIGGSLEAGPSGGVFRVRATLPYDRSFNPARPRGRESVS